MKKLTIFGIGISVSLILGTAGVVAYERSVTSRVSRLLEPDGLPMSVRREPIASHLTERLTVLGSELDQAIGLPYESLPDGGAPCAPWQWKLEHEAWLHVTVERAAPVLKELELLLNEPEAREILKGDESYAGDGAHAQWLMTLRHWTNFLSASAITNSRKGNHEQAAKSLGRALDLARLVNDQSVINICIEQVVIKTVLDAATQIAVEKPGSAIALRNEIEPRLSGRCYEGRGREALLSEYRQFFESTREDQEESPSMVAAVQNALELDSLVTAMEELKGGGFDVQALELNDETGAYLGSLLKVERLEAEFLERCKAKRELIASLASEAR